MFPSHATKMKEISQLPGSILDFLNWLFGLTGVPSIRVFAYGYFSPNGRFRADSHIFCRVTESGYSDPQPQDEAELGLNFRPIRATDYDYELWSLIERNKDFLAACPSDLLMQD